MRTKFFTLVHRGCLHYTKRRLYERNSLTAYSVGGHNIVLNWMTEVTDLLQFFVVSVKFGSDYASREAVGLLSF